MRGLKLHRRNGLPARSFWSHLLQMRGLKLLLLLRSKALRLSHLLQMRGLKLKGGVVVRVIHVASFTDAWIETQSHLIEQLLYLVASFTDAWIETRQSENKTRLFVSHLLQMRGLKLLLLLVPLLSLSRIFYRCVD